MMADIIPFSALMCLSDVQICELPPGEWSMKRNGGDIVLTCPDHPPRVIRDGVMTVLRWEA